MEDPENILKVVIPLVIKAGAYIVENCKKIKHIECKSAPKDFVTEIDKEVEKMLFEGLQNYYPKYKLIGEESFKPGQLIFTDDPTWIIDPIDGTRNYIHAFRYVAISIALVYKKQIILGIIYNPFKNQLFKAIKDKGAYYNGERIRVSNVNKLANALIIIGGTGHNEKQQNHFKTNLANLLDKCHGIRMIGSAALSMCAVAKGEIDAYFHFSIHCWDIAAGALIVQEAGGVCVDTEGGPLDIMRRRVLCASSQSIIDELTVCIKQIQMEPDAI